MTIGKFSPYVNPIGTVKIGNGVFLLPLRRRTHPHFPQPEFELLKSVVTPLAERWRQ